MEFKSEDYIMNLPANFDRSDRNQKQCTDFYTILLRGLADVANNGKVSEMTKMEVAKKIGDPFLRKFCEDTFKWFVVNKNDIRVIKNRKDVLEFFFKDGLGYPLVSKLYKEGKLINWPLLAQSISDPSFDFANSNVLKYFFDQSQRLDAKYAKSAPIVDKGQEL